MGLNRGRVWALLALVVLIVALVFWMSRRDRGSEQPVQAATQPSASVDAGSRADTSIARPAAPMSPNTAPTPVSVVAPQSGDGGATQGRVFATAPWGSQLGQLGHDRPQEANPEGPMSLATDAQGNVFVLDQLNHRIVRYGRDGRAAQSVPLTQGAAQDVAVGRDGTLAVLDRHADQNVAVVGPDGTPRGSLPIVGRGVAESGGVTGLVVDGNDVYVEREHGPLVRIGDLAGTVDTARPEIPGRPTRDGHSYLTAGLIDPAAGRFYVNSIARDTGDHRWTRELQIQFTLMSILLLDTDRAGTIYTAVLAMPPGTEETHGAHDLVVLMCLDPTDGHPIGQTALPPNTLPEETFRDFAVLDEGGVVYQVRDEHGVSLRRYDCR
ncbi:MAG: hypothetical protein WCJ30_16295 [Deltaproteobacteria bacterium]